MSFVGSSDLGCLRCSFDRATFHVKMSCPYCNELISSVGISNSTIYCNEMITQKQKLELQVKF